MVHFGRFDRERFYEQIKGAAQAILASLGGSQYFYSLRPINLCCQQGLKMLIFGILQSSFGILTFL